MTGLNCDSIACNKVNAVREIFPGSATDNGRDDFTMMFSIHLLNPTYLAIHLDQTLHADGVHLSACEGVLQAVAQHQHQRQALTLLVGTRSWLRCKHPRQFVQHPMTRGIKPLHMLLRPTSHGCWLGSTTPLVAASSSRKRHNARSPPIKGASGGLMIPDRVGTTPYSYHTIARIHNRILLTKQSFCTNS